MSNRSVIFSCTCALPLPPPSPLLPFPLSSPSLPLPHSSLPIAHSGLRNHKLFLLYLVILLIMLIWGVRASLHRKPHPLPHHTSPPPPPHTHTDLFTSYPADHGNFVVRTYHYITVDPWAGYMMVVCFVYLTWVYLLFVAQIFQVSGDGVGGEWL